MLLSRLLHLPIEKKCWAVYMSEQIQDAKLKNTEAIKKKVT